MIGQRVASSPYYVPRWDAPFDVEREIEIAPPHAMVRGMFFDFAVNRARHASGRTIPTESRVAFVQYPMRDYLRLLVEAATVAYPKLPLREALRRMGSHLYDDFLDTMVGRAIFSVAGRKFDRLVALAPKAYSTSYDPCTLKTAVVASNLALVKFEPMYVFMDTFTYGAWEGAARFCGVNPSIRVHVDRPGFGEFEITFT